MSTDQIKPISYLKAHAAEVIRNLSTRMEPLVITQNGEAKAVMQDIKSYEHPGNHGSFEDTCAGPASDRRS